MEEDSPFRREDRASTPQVQDGALSPRLKACPFCGGEPEQLNVPPDHYGVQCPNENCCARITGWKPGFAIAAWNKRAPRAAPDLRWRKPDGTQHPGLWCRMYLRAPAEAVGYIFEKDGLELRVPFPPKPGAVDDTEGQVRSERLGASEPQPSPEESQ